MNKTELRLLSYAYENYQKTLDPHCIYRWNNGNDMFFVSEALESLTEKGYISDVPSDIITGIFSPLTPFSFTITAVGIEYIRSQRES